MKLFKISTLTPTLTLALGLFLMGSATSQASDSKTTEVLTNDKAMVLMRKSGCITCHALDKTKIGPSFQDISAHYKDPKKLSYLKGKDTIEYLMEKVRKGTKKDNRNWTTSKDGKKYGMMTPMAAGRVSDENLKSLITYILSVK